MKVSQSKFQGNSNKPRSNPYVRTSFHPPIQPRTNFDIFVTRSIITTITTQCNIGNRRTFFTNDINNEPFQDIFNDLAQETASTSRLPSVHEAGDTISLSSAWPGLNDIIIPCEPTQQTRVYSPSNITKNKHDTVAGGSVRTDCFSGYK